MHEGELIPKDQLPYRYLSHVPNRLCREFPYGLPGTLRLAAERSTRSNACASFRWRAIGHSETLYRPLRVWNEKDGGLPRAAPCLVGFDVPQGIPCVPVLRSVGGVQSSRLLPVGLLQPLACVSAKHWCGSRASYANLAVFLR